MKITLAIIGLFLITFVCKAQTEWPDSILAYYDNCEFCWAANFMFVAGDKGSIEILNDYNRVIEASKAYKKVSKQDTSVMRRIGHLEFEANGVRYAFVNYSNVPLNEFYQKKSGIGTILIVCTYKPEKLDRKTVKIMYDAAMEYYSEYQEIIDGMDEYNRVDGSAR